MSTKQYKCDCCGGVFDFCDDWTDDDAKMEAEDKFGYYDDDMAVVCDDCYYSMNENAEKTLTSEHIKIISIIDKIKDTISVSGNCYLQMFQRSQDELIVHLLNAFSLPTKKENNMSGVPMISNIGIGRAVEDAIESTGIDVIPDDLTALRMKISKNLIAEAEKIRGRFSFVSGTMEKYTVSKNAKIEVVATASPGNLISLAGMDTDVIIFAPQSSAETMLRTKRDDKQADLFDANVIRVFDGKNTIDLQKGAIVTAMRDMLHADGESVIEKGQMLEFDHIEDYNMIFSDGLAIHKSSWDALAVDPAIQPKRGAKVVECDTSGATGILSLSVGDKIIALREMEHDNGVVFENDLASIIEVDLVEKTVLAALLDPEDVGHAFGEITIAESDLDGWGEFGGFDAIFSDLEPLQIIQLTGELESYSPGTLFEAVGIDPVAGQCSIREYLPEGSDAVYVGDGSPFVVTADVINANFVEYKPE